MATTKVTFTLDDETLARLSAAAERLAVPKSAVVRHAIRDFSERAGRLGESERRQQLDAFDRLVPLIPKRSRPGVERELEGLRRARRAGGRRSVGRGLAG
ncbi:MAG TPA: CopG family transcriptional regulator [Vicinamibacteria bacterium]|nr:CopG family transcriptional regulator [Vicinamibacteria bacterium]